MPEQNPPVEVASNEGLGLAPERAGQPRMMIIIDGAQEDETGHWYSPAAVREMLAAERDLQRRVSPQCWGPGQFVVVATFRYCLGRQTYIVQECADWLTLHWPVIEQPVRNLIQRELEAAFVKDDAIRAAAGPGTGYKPLGWDCDRREWERVRSLWANAELTGTLRREKNDAG